MTLAFALALRACFIVPGAIGLGLSLFANGVNPKVYRDWKLPAIFGGMVVIALLPFGIVRFVEGAPTPTTADWQPAWPTVEHPFNLALFGSALVALSSHSRAIFMSARGAGNTRNRARARSRLSPRRASGTVNECTDC